MQRLCCVTLASLVFVLLMFTVHPALSQDAEREIGVPQMEGVDMETPEMEREMSTYPEEEAAMAAPALEDLAEVAEGIPRSEGESSVRREMYGYGGYGYGGSYGHGGGKHGGKKHGGGYSYGKGKQQAVTYTTGKGSYGGHHHGKKHH